MSSSSAVGWMRLASFRGCRNHISTSPSGWDTELWAVCSVMLFGGVTLKAALKWALQMLLMPGLMSGLSVLLGTGADCSVALAPLLLYFLWQRICITSKFSCQQAGHILQSQHGNQMWIACELCVTACSSSWGGADHWQCCASSVVPYLAGSGISLCAYTHKQTCVLLKRVYRIRTSV